jgi:hypothetical protein
MILPEQIMEPSLWNTRGRQYIEEKSPFAGEMQQLGWWHDFVRAIYVCMEEHKFGTQERKITTIKLWRHNPIHTYPMRVPAWPVHLETVKSMRSWSAGAVMGV